MPAPTSPEQDTRPEYPRQERRSEPISLREIPRQSPLLSAQGPMQGAQRRIEARVGELLGEAVPGRHLSPNHGKGIATLADPIRADFRLLAHAYDDAKLTAEERRALAEASKAAAVVPIEPAPTLPGEGSLWIRCRAYRAHAHHHRRDPATGAFRCFICQPAGGEP